MNMAAYLPVALAVLCKESAVMLVPALVVCDWIYGTPLRALPGRHWPGVAVVLSWLTLTHDWLSTSVGGAVRPMGEQLLTQAKAVGYYAHLIAMPVGLNVEPQFQASRQLGPEVVLPALLMLSFVVVAWLVAGRRGRFLLVLAALWMLPTTLMPLNVLVNERRAYLLVAIMAVGVGLTFVGGTKPQPRALKERTSGRLIAEGRARGKLRGE